MTAARPTNRDAPTIVVTLAVPEDQERPELTVRRNELYLAAVARHGAVTAPLTARSTSAQRADAFAAMGGLLLSGGGDVDPARYGRPNEGSREIEPERDELEAEAWAFAASRGAPVLGICRGIQVINVFSGGTLLQHVDGHVGFGWGIGPATTHPIRVVPGTRLATMLDAGADTLEVNAYHHQGILAADLAPGLRASAWASSRAGPLVEGLEGTDGRFVVGVQCHPERAESTPDAFERLFAAFVRAAATRVRAGAGA